MKALLVALKERLLCASNAMQERARVFFSCYLWFKDASPCFSVFWSNGRYADLPVREAMLAPWQVCLHRLLLGEFLLPASKWQNVKEPAQTGSLSLGAICSVQFEKNATEHN